MTDSLSPDQLVREAGSAYNQKDYQKAAQAFLAAAAGYECQGDRLSSAEMKNNASVAWLRSGNAAAALAALHGTEMVFAQAGDTRRQAIAIGNRAAALDSLDRNDEAVIDYEQSAQLFKEIGETDLSASALRSLSILQLRIGNQLEALASMQAGLVNIQKPGIRQKFAKKLLKTSFSFLGR